MIPRCEVKEDTIDVVAEQLKLIIMTVSAGT